jgi:hypothetical protein
VRGAAVVALAVAASTASAGTLEEAARRERERRAETRQAGASATPIGNDELAAVPRDGGRGTFSAAPERARPSEPAGRGDRDRGRDVARPTALKHVEAQCARLPAMGSRLLQQAAADEACRARPVTNARASSSGGGTRARGGRSGTASSPFETASRCDPLRDRARQTAAQLTRAMDDVDETGRRAGLLPGEVRAARARHGLDGGEWMEVERTLARYR